MQFITELENVKNSSSSKAHKTKKRKKKDQAKEKVFDDDFEPSRNMQIGSHYKGKK